MLSGNAAGQPTPVLLILAGKRMPNQINTYLPNTWCANVSDSGWMNCDIFYDYVTKKFYPWLQENQIHTPVVLFVDGHVSHRSLNLSKFCLEKGIILISLIPNSTHLLQPMDVVVFGPTKRKWAAMLKDFRRANQKMERMPKEIFVRLLNECLNECLTMSTLQSSFSKTALYPFDANNFNFSQLPSHNNDDIAHSSEITTHVSFLSELEKLIDSTLPGKIEEFKNSLDAWSGDMESHNLFLLWSAAGGKRSVYLDEESYELLEVVGESDETFENVESFADETKTDTIR